MYVVEKNTPQMSVYTLLNIITWPSNGEARREKGTTKVVAHALESLGMRGMKKCHLMP